MLTRSGFGKSSDSYLKSQFYIPQEDSRETSEQKRPFVTISRQTGAGGLTIAKKLAEYLQKYDRKSRLPWTVFEKNIVVKSIEHHRLPDHFRKFLKEKKVSEVDDALEELFGIHPSKWSLIRKVSETILHLAKSGNVIIVGRGANIVTRSIPGGLRVRLIGSLAQRTKFIQENYRLSPKKALEFIRKRDRDKKGYIRKYFDKDIEDPMLYDIIINTDFIKFDETARMIAGEILHNDE